MAQQHHWNFSTRAVHVGNEVDKETGAIRRPITMANSYALPYDPTDMNWSSADGNLYTRNGGANQKYLQEKLSSLEGGEDCVVLASGVAALSGLFFSLLQTGDHVIFSSVTYIAVYRLLNELFNNKFNVETTIVNTYGIYTVIPTTLTPRIYITISKYDRPCAIRTPRESCILIFAIQIASHTLIIRKRSNLIIHCTHIKTCNKFRTSINSSNFV